MATDLSNLFTGPTLSLDDLIAMRDAVIGLLNAQQSSSTNGATADDSNDPKVDIYNQNQVLIGKIDSADGKWHEQTIVGGDVVDFGTAGTDGRQCSSTSDPSNFTRLNVNQALLVEIPDPPDHCYICIPGGAFPVAVSSDGGSAGDGSTQCSFTYTVNDLSGNAVNTKSDSTGSAVTTAAPVWARPALGKLVAATHGWGYYDSGGAFVLFQVDEVDAVVKRDCPS